MGIRGRHADYKKKKCKARRTATQDHRSENGNKQKPQRSTLKRYCAPQYGRTTVLWKIIWPKFKHESTAVLHTVSNVHTNYSTHTVLDWWKHHSIPYSTAPKSGKLKKMYDFEFGKIKNKRCHWKFDGFMVRRQHLQRQPKKFKETWRHLKKE